MEVAFKTHFKEYTDLYWEIRQGLEHEKPMTVMTPLIARLVQLERSFPWFKNEVDWDWSRGGHK